ncbi:MAG: hypothetical protein ACR2GB_08035, partial [Nocardioidaceae bacterium]
MRCWSQVLRRRRWMGIPQARLRPPGSRAAAVREAKNPQVDQPVAGGPALAVHWVAGTPGVATAGAGCPLPVHWVVAGTPGAAVVRSRTAASQQAAVRGG